MSSFDNGPLKQGPGNPPNLLRQLGLDRNDQGGLGILPGPNGSVEKHLFDGIGPIEQETLKHLGRTFRFLTRDVVRLYRHLDGKLSDTINIVTKAHAMPDVTIQQLIDAQAPQVSEYEVGQPLRHRGVSIDIKTSARQYLHLDFDQSVQNLAFSKDGALDLAANIMQHLLDMVAPDVDMSDAPTMHQFLTQFLDSAASDQDRLDRAGH